MTAVMAPYLHLVEEAWYVYARVGHNLGYVRRQVIWQQVGYPYEYDHGHQGADY